MDANELEAIVERTKTRFLGEIMELSNGEVEIVLENLTAYFEEALEQVRQAGA